MLVGDELRAEILRVLGVDPNEGLPFSELRERVEMDVYSGQFDYHLQKLVGHFVGRTDDGYEIHAARLALYRDIRAGRFNRRPELDPFAVGFECYYCRTAVEASSEDSSFRLRCPDCEHVYTHTMLPPSGTTSSSIGPAPTAAGSSTWRSA